MLTDTLKSTCHPFAANNPSDLVNISTGKAASSETTSYLLSTFQRGNEARHKFERECLTDFTRFMKTLSRIDIKNIKRKTMESRKLNVAEGGLILYEVLVQHTTSSYVDIATELLARVCSLQGMEIHLLLDKYKSPSLENERKLRCRPEEVFTITGPQQIQKQPCVKLVKKNVPLKKSFLNLC